MEVRSGRGHRASVWVVETARLGMGGLQGGAGRALARKAHWGWGWPRHRQALSICRGSSWARPCVRNSVCLISHIFVDLALWSLITYVILPYHLSTLVVNEFQEPRELVSLVH